jgi:TonB family protein
MRPGLALLLVLYFSQSQAPAPAPSTELCVTHVETLHYPTLARQARVQGEIKVSAMVDETGKVILPAASAGSPLLRDAAIANLRKWTFRPSPSGSFTIDVAYEFVLRSSANVQDEECFFDFPSHVRIVANPPPLLTTNSSSSGT